MRDTHVISLRSAYKKDELLSADSIFCLQGFAEAVVLPLTFKPTTQFSVLKPQKLSWRSLGYNVQDICYLMTLFKKNLASRSLNVLEGHSRWNNSNSWKIFKIYTYVYVYLFIPSCIYIT